jgi:protein-S-isoprenylcysteine O-methyltransferase Ste14
MRLANGAIAAAWLIFFVYWFWKWRDAKATAQPHDPVQRRLHIIPTIIGIVLIETGWRKPAPLTPLGLGLWRATPVIQWIALLVVLAGLAIAIRARVVLATNWSADVEVKEDHELLTRGPYAWVRHPIYTGILTMLAGTAIAMGTGAALLGLVLATVGFNIKLRQEEVLMRAQFASAYADYERRVKRLVPFIW